MCKCSHSLLSSLIIDKYRQSINEERIRVVSIFNTIEACYNVKGIYTIDLNFNNADSTQEYFHGPTVW